MSDLYREKVMAVVWRWRRRSAAELEASDALRGLIDEITLDAQGDQRQDRR